MGKQPICPHCGEGYNIDKNESYFLYTTDDVEELTCGGCEKLFFVMVHTTHSFETKTEIVDF